MRNSISGVPFPNARCPAGARREQGSALIVALVFLLAMTLIGVAAMQGTTQEEKMANNMRNRNLAFQAGESVLRDGEEWLRPKQIQPVSTGFPCSNTNKKECVYQKNTLPSLPGLSQDKAWWSNNARQYGVAATKEISNVATDPYCVVEEHAFLRDELSVGHKATPTGRDLYRVTARGTGATDEAIVMLRTIYAKRFN
jgi:type IV pilus assembly protein PilX